MRIPLTVCPPIYSNIAADHVPELHEQLSTSIRSLYTHDRITNPDVDTFWAIFNVLRNGGGLADLPAFALLEDVGDWLRRSMESNLPIEDKILRIIKCSEGIANVYLFFHAQAQIDQARNHVEFDQMESLVRLLDDLLTSLPGGASSVLTPWAADAWQLTKEGFLAAS